MVLELFARVPDGQVGQGRDHPVAAVLALAAAAVVAGMKGYTAIAADQAERMHMRHETSEAEYNDWTWSQLGPSR